jgi:CPW-WPC domain-containing protein
MGFVSIGEVFGDGDRCGPDLRIYSGPCKDRTIKFGHLTVRAKQHWARLCGFQWPCQKCKKDYNRACPRDWYPDLAEGNTVCRATDKYQGPCDTVKNFMGFNEETKDAWSLECLAPWDCV